MPTSFSTFNPGDLIEDTHIEQYIEPIQNLEMGKPWYGELVGSSSTTLEVDLDPAPSAYSAGMLVHFKSNVTTAGASTLNVNGLGAKPLVKEGTNSLVAGDIANGQVVSAVYDGASFQLLSPVLLPTTTTPPPATDVLVYSGVTQAHSSGTAATYALPDFDFDPAKSYRMEVHVQGEYNTTANARVVLTGSSTYSYPSASTYIKPRYIEPARVVNKLLPTLSGVHSIDVVQIYCSYVMIRLYELNDNLVYADFSPEVSNNASVKNTLQLADFVATSGHTYLLTMTACPFSTGTGSVSCYVTDGSIIEGIPLASPTTTAINLVQNTGNVVVTRFLEGLSGSYDVFVSGRACGTVGVEIRDVT